LGSREKLLNTQVGEKTTRSWIFEILNSYNQINSDIAQPVHVEKLCKIIEKKKKVKIKCEFDNSPSVWEEGLLIPVTGGFIIRCKTLAKDGKKFLAFRRKTRETIVHELAHILAYDCRTPIPRPSENLPEHIFHFIARELLVPAETIKNEYLLNYSKLSTSRIKMLKYLSNQFIVAHKIIADRLTTDLSIIKDTMFTFWKSKNKDPQIRYFRPDELCFKPESKLSDELREYLPSYWRQRVYIEVLSKVINKAVYGDYIKEFLCIKGKKKKNGQLKNIPFEIECQVENNPFNCIKLDLRTNNNYIYDKLLTAVKFESDFLKTSEFCNKLHNTLVHLNNQA